VWDCTNLSSVSEVLNRSGQDWGHVAHAGVLPRPQLKEDDLIGGQWPAIGIMCAHPSYYLSDIDSSTRTTIEGESSSTFLVYSLYRQRVVKRLPLKGGLATFVSNDHFIVIVSFYLFHV
jgi:hypothetical protein